MFGVKLNIPDILLLREVTTVIIVYMIRKCIRSTVYARMVLPFRFPCYFRFRNLDQIVALLEVIKVSNDDSVEQMTSQATHR